MFDPSDRPRVFGIPPGADFPALLVSETLDRFENQPPEALARLRILVNTRRMQRRLAMLFAKGSPRLLPKIGLVTEVAALIPGADLPATVTPLRRRLELAQLVKALIERDPGLVPRTSAVDLADSLAKLIDEMQSEGATVDALETVEIGDDSMHWELSLRFLRVAKTYLDQISNFGVDTEARRRMAVEIICDQWSAHPPKTPVIIAGSTGSRATTTQLMRCVARLPQGALVLPGFDFNLPSAIWDSLAKDRSSEDHPQYRFAALLASLEMPYADVVRLGQSPDERRNALISLSLRPARVTDQWLIEGPQIGDLKTATAGMTLIEAPQPAAEAQSIAVALREAVEQGKKAALITPNRTLTRRVVAALGRWGITPDDSVGVMLSLTPPGRFLRQVIRLVGQPATPKELVPLLKHPLTCSGAGNRGDHVLRTQSFETFLRKRAVVAVSNDDLAAFVKDKGGEVKVWANWLSRLLDQLAQVPAPNLADMASRHLMLSESISGGLSDGSGKLWETSAGRATRAEIAKLLAEVDFHGDVTLADYARLVENALSAESDRQPDRAHPDIMIWGTLEARVQGAEIVVLGGLNENDWPEQPSPDPWLNRRMRRQLGLLLPEREIGLAAHDFQQAAAANEVILSRAKRTEESETVPSRWLNRLTNLLSGLPETGGNTALRTMRARGDRLLELAEKLDVAPGQQRPATLRPAPSPPLASRPKRFSVTEIKTLIRDPYAIYARRILNLEPFPPLVPTPDARLKGIVFHEILEKFFSLDTKFDDPLTEMARLHSLADGRLRRYVPWPAVRSEWLGQIDRTADWLIGTEAHRLLISGPLARECRGEFIVPNTAVTIVGKADRIDRLHDGRLVIYDYKTGQVPSKRQVRYFERQLLIEAVMAELGAFEGVIPAPVARVVHLDIGRSPEAAIIDLIDDGDTDYKIATVSRELAQLLNSFASLETGYISRRAMEEVRYEGDYDHLSRFGEWGESAETKPEQIG